MLAGPAGLAAQSRQGGPAGLAAQSRQGAGSYTVSGYVTDAASGERLIGATVYDTVSRQGTVTNTAGFYTMSIVESRKQKVESD